MPKVSVVMPVYNCEDLIAPTVRSVLAQTEKDFELVVMDDGSTDGTLNVLRRLAREDRRIQLHTQPNSGLPAIARNAALSHASGQYICFLDGDDLYHPDKLKRQLSVFEQYPDVSLVFHEVKLFASDPQEEGETYYARRTDFLQRAKDYLRPVGETTYLCHLDFYNFMSIEINVLHTSSVLFRRTLLDKEKVWFPEIELGEDTDLWFRLAKGRRLAYIDEALSYYRQRPGSMSTVEERAARMMVIVMSENLKRGMDVFSAEEVKKYRSKIADDYFSLGYLYFQKGKYAQARSAYRRCLAMKPGLKALKGHLLTFLPAGVIKRLRKGQRE